LAPFAVEPELFAGEGVEALDAGLVRQEKVVVAEDARADALGRLGGGLPEAVGFIRGLLGGGCY
jgi:hypothetical protein